VNGPGNGHYVTPAMVEKQAASLREHYRRVKTKGAEASSAQKGGGAGFPRIGRLACHATSAPKKRRRE